MTSVLSPPIIPSNKRQSTAPKKEIWTSLLNSVSSGKRLAEKQLVVLGSTPESQREFISTLETDPSHQPSSRGQFAQKPPVANDFALGYTYQDVLDTDHEDILARLSIYTLSKPSPHFIPLLRPLFTPETIPNMLLVILLDWSQPWNWMRQLREWIRLLDNLFSSLPKETQDVLEENEIEWKANKRNNFRDPGTSVADGASNLDEDVTLPLGPGEWDLPLGVPLCVVCQNSNLIEALEKDSGWKDRHFDFVQQFLRTVLLKHGGSLIYTMPHLPDSSAALHRLIHSSLGIKSMLQKQTLKHNTTNRDHILVPPNFDSWGKIRILTEDFNLEDVSQAWARDIKAQTSTSDAGQETTDQTSNLQDDAVLMYEEFIVNPDKDNHMTGLPQKQASSGLEVLSKDTQEFLSEQSAILEGLSKEDERSQQVREPKKQERQAIAGAAGDVEEHIGPVQFNMGGIQMDAEDMVKRLKDREANRSAEPDRPKTPPLRSDKGEMDNAQLASFFTSLIKTKTGSAANSPKRRPDTRA